tara:strand:+ start:252 stop:521 length:270 start_codon:yes stop_codon:yes gene_type:complete
MEIPTKETIENLGRLTVKPIDFLPTAEIALNALDTINDLGIEIQELQSVVCRLKKEIRTLHKSHEIKEDLLSILPAPDQDYIDKLSISG